MTKTERLEEIDVIRKFYDQVHILGWNKQKGFYDCTKKLCHIIHDLSTGNIIEEDSFLQKDESYVLVRGLLLFGVGIPFLIYDFLIPKEIERRKKTKEYYRQVERFKIDNMSDLTEAIKDIKVYQDSKDDIARDLGKELKRVDTEKPETFIKAEDTFWLRVKAYCLNADAVVNYQPGSSVGTPVKYLDKG